MVRIAHLGRSAFTHESAITYWLEAFRGKGKRQGARRAYTWAMIRHGLSGYDVAKVLYDVWFEWSEAVGYPLDYVVMDPESGACKWRKGVAQCKPIAPRRVIWQGERDAAVSMRIGFCPASVC